MANYPVVTRRPHVPPEQTRRPPEPLRPLPARQAGVSLLGVKARRRRWRHILPPRAGEGGW